MFNIYIYIYIYISGFQTAFVSSYFHLAQAERVFDTQQITQALGPGSAQSLTSVGQALGRAHTLTSICRLLSSVGQAPGPAQPLTSSGQVVDLAQRLTSLARPLRALQYEKNTLEKLWQKSGKPLVQSRKS